VGVLPEIGPKYDELWAKYTREESRERIVTVRVKLTIRLENYLG
jgi:hypothetical protein